MFEQSDNFSNRSSASFSTRYLLAFLILFGGFAIFFNLGGRGVENKDYLRYPEIAREILEFNDWTMLRHQGEIYVDKPPLHFWLIAGTYKILGVTPFAARVPAAMAALAGLLMAFFLGRKIFQNSETGFLAALMLLSAYGYYWWARRTRIDMEFAVFFSLALIFFYYGLEATSSLRKSFWYMAFWLATGCAFMDKAFIALSTLVVVIPYSVMVSVSKNDARKVSPFLLLATSPVLVLPILPWVVSLMNHPEFSAYRLLLEQTKIMTRQRGFFFYFYEFPAKFFPVFPFLFMGIWAFFKYRKEIPERRALVFPLVWMATYLAMLHLTAAKNTRYLLPIFLPCALVSAWSFQFYQKKAARVMKKVLDRVNAVFFVVALLSITVPFIFAYNSTISLIKPLPYVVALFVAFITAWRYLPLKYAGFFISFIVLLLSIEIGEGIHDEKTSDYNSISQRLRAEGLSAEEIAFHPCSSRSRWGVGFYYNARLRCSDNLIELATDPKVRGIVTTQQAFEKLLSHVDSKKLGQLYSFDEKRVVIIK
ncbi:MAG: glycosyltransferase family 39 protein [Desulfobacterales bacterium]